MSKSGQSNFTGISAQKVYTPVTSLESSEGEDFDLVFKNGKKIICESKAWNRNFSYRDLEKILHNIISKKSINTEDEILIICPKRSDRLKRDSEKFKYWENRFVSVFRNKGFSQESINILDKVEFLVIEEETNRKIVQSLFNELLGIWLPKEKLESKVDSLFVNQFDKSKKGIEFSRDEIIVEIEEIKKEAKKSSGYFDKERCKIEEQFDTISDALKNNMSPVWAPSQLSAISAQPDLLFYILRGAKKQKNR